MINGLQVDVKSDELSKILQERMKHHEDKSHVYEVKAAELAKTIKDIEEDMTVGKVSGGTPAENLVAKSREHREKASYYKFMIDHVIQNDVYRLGQEDLQRLGITTRFY